MSTIDCYFYYSGKNGVAREFGTAFMVLDRASSMVIGFEPVDEEMNFALYAKEKKFSTTLYALSLKT